MFIIIVGVALSISFGLRYGTDSNDIDTTKEYALTDKVIRSYNSKFCQGLQAMSEDGVYDRSTATLYLMKSRPPLTDHERFNTSETTSFTYSNYEYWNFYLNKGSKVSFKACYQSDVYYYGTTFYLIRGSKNHKRWLEDHDNTALAVTYQDLDLKCQNVSIQIQNDDLYFLSFYSDSYEYTTLELDFQFDRTVYHISPESMVHNCSFPLDGLSSCSIDVPMSSGYTAVLSLNTSLPVDYDDGANVHINCQPRVWLYAVIVVCTVVPVIIVIVLVVVCVCIKVRRGKKKYSPINTTTGTEAFEDSGNVNRVSIIGTPSGVSAPATQPPPFNSAYPPAGGYGAISTVPPPAYTK